MAEKGIWLLNSLSVWSSRKKQKHLCSCMDMAGEKKNNKKQAFAHTCPQKKRMPPLPSEHRGWNAGKGDCGIATAT